ncbi:class I SAM-dependent methyltransferase [Nocardia xishanensis]|uniref:class I SAM-dependent methyltransferase n=1 Tax=Nocardia xishanensis TaxID=238964 RepID=UPI0033D32360
MAFSSAFVRYCRCAVAPRPSFEVGLAVWIRSLGLETSGEPTFGSCHRAQRLAMSWSSPTSSPGDRYYTLPNAWDFADERLALLGAAYDSGSIALAQRLGVKAGWRCLEAGAGGGSFARLLRSAALPGGRVLAVDADPRHLADLPGLGGEVAQLDLVANDIPERAFDFVHTRVVLLHIADRDIVLERLARALAPGGVLAG